MSALFNNKNSNETLKQFPKFTTKYKLQMINNNYRLKKNWTKLQIN